MSLVEYSVKVAEFSSHIGSPKYWFLKLVIDFPEEIHEDLLRILFIISLEADMLLLNITFLRYYESAPPINIISVNFFKRIRGH